MVTALGPRRLNSGGSAASPCPCPGGVSLCRYLRACHVLMQAFTTTASNLDRMHRASTSAYVCGRRMHGLLLPSRLWQDMRTCMHACESAHARRRHSGSLPDETFIGVSIISAPLRLRTFELSRSSQPPAICRDCLAERRCALARVVGAASCTRMRVREQARAHATARHAGNDAPWQALLAFWSMSSCTRAIMLCKHAGNHAACLLVHVFVHVSSSQRRVVCPCGRAEHAWKRSRVRVWDTRKARGCASCGS